MKINFSVSPRVLSHLGGDLIKNESIALFELIKNAYDACAKHCIVDFYFENDKLYSLTIEDDGFGMNLDIIKNVWLVVGTDYKKKNLELNKCGRIPLGEKGIGRLSIHKLGNKIELTSKMKTNDEVQLFIDWNKLESVDSIDDFTIELLENTTPKIFKNSTGTKIVIKDLKGEWDRRQLREVYRNVTSLNSPFTDIEEAFNVVVDSNKNIFEGLPDFKDILKMEILTKRGEVKELSRIMQVSKVTVIKALKFRTDSDLAKKIRTTAIKRGGVKIDN